MSDTKEKTKGSHRLELLSNEKKLMGLTEREKSLEARAEKLANRVSGLEGQLKKMNKVLEKQQKFLVQSPQESEATHLSKMVEQKIRKFAEEFSPQKQTGNGARSAVFIYEQLKQLAHAVSLDSFKKLLVSLWYGGPPPETEIDDFGMDTDFALKAKPFFDFLYYTYWRVSVQGANNIPDQGRGLVVANHSGTLPFDGCMIRLASENDTPSRRDIRFLVEDFVYHFPFLGTFMYRTGGVRACQENATRLLETDHLVTVFPEGVKGIGKHYKNRYRLQRFGRGGFIRLALRTRTPIIPTAIIGAEEIYPLIYKSSILAKPLGIPYIPITPTFPLLGPLGLIPLPTKWTVIFGEPMDFKEYGPEHAEDRLLVNQLSEQVRLRIQEMILDGLANRRSVWFG